MALEEIMRWDECRGHWVRTSSNTLTACQHSTAHINMSSSLTGHNNWHCVRRLQHIYYLSGNQHITHIDYANVCNVNNKFIERTGTKVSSALGCHLQYCANLPSWLMHADPYTTAFQHFHWQKFQDFYRSTKTFSPEYTYLHMLMSCST